MIDARPVGRLLRRPARILLVQCLVIGAALMLSAALAGQAVAGVRGTPYSGFERRPQTCPAGTPALTPERIRAILKRRGYYAIRDLRYLKPDLNEWIAPVSATGHYVATASRGFGLVRWQLTVDACTAHVAVARGGQTHTH